ncbi:bifunctional 3-deoxy-7-phosphoheptulonate synthase/chorismate mutase [Cohnella nanjingensis]|uniref:Bifunctional 3-deoxy-7-phosphoheptulonate synthase/chorismate mutase n=1 Tax=Cohnella nanjingensis TaxID=1387779 RepID=A0A7X0VET8_9BACL|nr:bifunctional 3-deoxy-7-phosphoheptulonate synthase/chorismate mutase [Cohnella nanjingensis]MBB6670583.1 bifunctional 3-deoxy-7-phosphoheptulonate synthase/chorismate mutase [Cohnella nanjingensis]
MSEELQKLQLQLNGINLKLLHLLSEQARTADEIVRIKEKQGISEADPIGVQQMVNELASHNPGPIDNDTVMRIFMEIFNAYPKKQQNEKKERKLLVSRSHKSEDTIIRVKHAEFGGTSHVTIAGPCSIESREQLLTVAAALKNAGVTVLRGGAFKPRTSPYEFQGLGVEGLKIMKEAADEIGMVSISEIMSPSQIDTAARYVDIFQIGARNMQNFELLKAVGQSGKPVLLKRGLSATLEEFILAAEYILYNGNNQVMLIERGIRTFEKWTRNTLDISAVPLLKQETHLPVLVDVSHSAGRKDILLSCAKAALAAGADGIMVEVHPNPQAALSDAKQQLNIDEFDTFWKGLRHSGLFKSTKPHE